jgi:hypothetical protein
LENSAALNEGILRICRVTEWARYHGERAGRHAGKVRRTVCRLAPHDRDRLLHIDWANQVGRDDRREINVVLRAWTRGAQVPAMISGGTRWVPRISRSAPDPNPGTRVRSLEVPRGVGVRKRVSAVQWLAPLRTSRDVLSRYPIRGNASPPRIRSSLLLRWSPADHAVACLREASMTLS